MKENFYIDDTDKRILKFLSVNTRMPFTEIAKKMNVSAGTIHVRVKKMEDAGVIRGTSLNIDYSILGYGFIVYVGILLTKSSKTQSVLEKLALIPNVTTANVISGKYNIYCKISAKDPQDAKNVIYKIDDIEDVLRTESMISLEESLNDQNRLMDALFL
ncbi:winged helix-turn-helix transcriptional regulator [Apibacter muscae]|uniref:Winged helix-turn-helix transcriptional regulator n=1 Tax=Apibacter muscae TaxID=2509004 RepID=A0A563DGL0_9FLAO|nr:winged helix-turn-helix transcriptional regulator [Apibacter muscae]TWP23678.1 winged helix-turn-helix transcriptional regulator [Apibacter muscae]TWP28964.1 winged helix-turn-helix transcriptional regulator [Apibacter muscae]TWP30459.1 winged helix-turn-helix transcriptional regulator [Apibacter muscae]